MRREITSVEETLYKLIQIIIYASSLEDLKTQVLDLSYDMDC